MDDQTASIEQDPRWAAVAARDAAQDGAFVYAVTSTGIYCRPSCPAKRPRLDRVLFFAGCHEAEQAGFRACRRCKPDAEAQQSLEAARIAAACRMIEAAEAPPALEDLATAAGLSPAHFHRRFKAVTGVTPKAYAAAVRAQKVQETLAAAPTVTQAVYDAGYNAGSRFYEQSGAVLGMTPSTYRRGGAGMQIHFAVGDCALGVVLVARSPVGVCAILLGDHPQHLVDELQDRFPSAELIGGDPGYENLIAAVIAAVDAPATGSAGLRALPLDIRGTAFQRRVWEALQAIPPGETATYAEIAARIGAPNAVRAVGAACGANPLGVAVPCHRVVRSDGGLAGYRWGVTRKRALLTREGVNLDDI